MKTFQVSINARFDTTVEAETYQEAEKHALDEFYSFGADDVDVESWDISDDE